MGKGVEFGWRENCFNGNTEGALFPKLLKQKQKQIYFVVFILSSGGAARDKPTPDS